MKAGPSTIDRPSPALAGSELWRRGGFHVTRELAGGDLAELRAESVACHRRAALHRKQEPGRNGDTEPARLFETAPGGPCLDAFYRAASARRLLARLTGREWRPVGLQGSYSYYRDEGQYLGLHRDVEECQAAIITCLVEEGAPARGVRGALCLYPGRWRESLDLIRAAPGRGARLLRLQPGESVVLLGGIVPHWTVPTAAGQLRVVAPLCYRLADRPEAPPA